MLKHSLTFVEPAHDASQRDQGGLNVILARRSRCRSLGSLYVYFQQVLRALQKFHVPQIDDALTTLRAVKTGRIKLWGSLPAVYDRAFARTLDQFTAAFASLSWLNGKLV